MIRAPRGVCEPRDRDDEVYQSLRRSYGMSRTELFNAAGPATAWAGESARGTSAHGVQSVFQSQLRDRDILAASLLGQLPFERH